MQAAYISLVLLTERESTLVLGSSKISEFVKDFLKCTSC